MSWQGLVTAIGVVHASRTEPIDDGWDAVSSSIELDERFPAAVTMGLEAFSHLEVIYAFHLLGDEPSFEASRRPRSNPAWPEVGIFAQRAKDRPNRLGLSTCRLVSVDGRHLEVAGLDAIDGTPVLDLKPSMVEFGPRGPHHQPAWASELMAGYFDAR